MRKHNCWTTGFVVNYLHVTAHVCYCCSRRSLVLLSTSDFESATSCKKCIELQVSLMVLPATKPPGVYSSYAELLSEIQTSPGMHGCPLCNFKRTWKNKLTLHLESHWKTKECYNGMNASMHAQCDSSEIILKIYQAISY